MVRRHPARWVLFKLCVGNKDNPAKTLSIDSAPGTGVTLTPFHDPMCTRPYAGLSPEFAFAIGGEVRPDEMNAQHLALLARQLGVRPRCLAQLARDRADRVPKAIDQGGAIVVPGATGKVVSVRCRTSLLPRE